MGGECQLADQQRFTKIEFGKGRDFKLADQRDQLPLGEHLVFLPVAGQHLERVGEALCVHRAGASVIVSSGEWCAEQVFGTFDLKLMKLRPACNKTLNADGEGWILCVRCVP